MRVDDRKRHLNKEDATLKLRYGRTDSEIERARLKGEN